MRVLIAFTLCLSAWAASNSPVADAAMRGDKPAVRTLLSQKADVNAAQPDGATALQWAAYNDDMEAADLLIAAGANVKAANREGVTALYLAALHGSAPMVDRLLRAGADPNEGEAAGETPLMLAARSGSVEAIRTLVDHKADLNARDKLRGTTALMWAITEGHAEAVQFLIAHGADVAAATDVDTRNSRNNLADTVTARLNSPFGAVGQARAGAGGRTRSERAGPQSFAPGDDTPEVQQFFTRVAPNDGGGLTPLVYASREGCLECAKALLAAGADVNQRTRYGWTPLLVATQNRRYRLAAYLLDHGADPNVPNSGGWRPLYLATDNRNIEIGDYPVREPDMDHLEFIKLLIAKGANVNARVCGVASTPEKCVGDSTETRNNFTMQWLYEDGAAPFLRAAQSGDIPLMKLLLEHGANPKIFTAHGVTPLEVAAGIGWTEGVTFEWSPEQTMQAVKMCLDLGIDVNNADEDGRTALHGAAHKGRLDVIQLLVDHGAKLDAEDGGSRDSVNGALLGKKWVPLDWARGLVRVGVQSAIAHPEAEMLLVKLMKDKGLPIPLPPVSSICLTKGLNGCQ